MEHLNVSEQLTGLERLVLTNASRGHPLAMTVVYEEAATRKWSRDLYERVAKLSGGVTVRGTWWRISDLSEPGVLAGAVSTAMRADLLVVATCGSEGLPLPFYVWVNSWLSHRLNSAGALIALMGMPQAASSQQGRVVQYLREVARQARLDFLGAQKDLQQLPSEQA